MPKILLALFVFLCVSVSPTFAQAAGILNPSFETGGENSADSWTANAVGTAATFTIATTSLHTGSGTRAAQVSITTYTAGGDAKWMPAPVTVTAGDAYSVSLWYKSSTSTILYARYNDSDTQSDSSGFHWLAELSPQADWAQYTLDSQVIPTGVTKIQFFTTLESEGIVTVDDYNFATSTPPAPVTFSEGRVTLTFDDGWMSAFTNAVPVLNAANIKGTFYLNTQPLTDDYTDYMQEGDVQSLVYKGHDIGGHTATHADVTLPATNLATEIDANRVFLQNLATTSPLNSFAYPYGNYNDTVIAHLRDVTGYTGARTVDEGYNYTNTDKFKLKIQHVVNPTIITVQPDGSIGSSLADIKGWIDTAYAEHTWLILMFHQVQAATTTCGTDIECTSKDIVQGTVDYLTNPTRPVCVLTMSQALTNTPCGSTPPPTNHTPTVANPIADQVANEGVAFTFAFPANTFADADNDTLTYAATTLPTWLSFNATTRTFTGTPTNADVGTHTVVVRASDPSTASVTDTFLITVGNSNGAPTISTANFSIAENTAAGTFVGSTTASDADVGDVLTYTIVSGNTNNAFALDTNTGVITVATASALDFETSPAFQVVIKVTDSSALSAVATTTINLTDVSETTPDPTPTPTPSSNGSGCGGCGGGGGGVVLGLIGSVTTNTVPSVLSGNGLVLGTSTTFGFIFTKPLMWGSRGNDVNELHKVLIAGGYLNIPAPTGWFGPLTFAAVKKYQQEHGIDMVGIVGPITRASLNSH